MLVEKMMDVMIAMKSSLCGLSCHVEGIKMTLDEIVELCDVP